MKFITIDGDDVGQKITSSYLNNDVSELVRVNSLIQSKTKSIAEYLEVQGFKVIFCAADGVAGVSDSDFDGEHIYSEVKRIAGQELSFSVGVGDTLRDAYVALLYAKSSGKAQLRSFHEMGDKCSG